MKINEGQEKRNNDNKESYIRDMGDIKVLDGRYSRLTETEQVAELCREEIRTVEKRE